MGLNWNEIKSRALLFSKTWVDASNEDSEAKPFWIAFFEIFGITDTGGVCTHDCTSKPLFFKIVQIGDKVCTFS